MTVLYRSVLFVPGSRPERFAKAAAAGAGAIIIDLEDAVPPEEKARARAETVAWLAARDDDVVAGLRINSPRTADGCADIAAIAASAARPDVVMVPKTETAVDVEIVEEALDRRAPLLAVIETVRGLENAHAIAERCAAGLLFGGADFSAQLGVSLDWEPLAYARSRIAAAAAGAGVAAYDVPDLDVHDSEGLRASTDRARRLGFSGRACIHPAQVETVNGVFAPTADEVDDAKAIIAALSAADGGAVLHKGKLVDRPVVLAAERVLARAAEESS